MTGVISSSVSTRSPIATTPPVTAFIATHPPSANAGLIDTPATVTCRSLRGKLNRCTSPGWTTDGLPTNESTAFQLTESAGGANAPEAHSAEYNIACESTNIRPPRREPVCVIQLICQSVPGDPRLAMIQL